MKAELFFCLASFIRAAYSGDAWRHQEGGIKKWPEVHCGGSRQSGINIITEETVYKESLFDFEILGDNDEETVTMKNNGHSVALESRGNIKVTGGGLPSEYHLHHAHFHWGTGNTNGSEHQINGASFPLEMHFVTFNFEKYPSLATAVKSGAGEALAVLGVQFKLSSQDNPSLLPVTDKLSLVWNSSDPAELDGFRLTSLLPQDTYKYYRYEGSLTTPNCSEIVLWTVMATLHTISEDQLDKFRALVDNHGNPISDNWRPVQSLNGRTIYSSFQDPQDTSPDNNGNLYKAVKELIGTTVALSLLFRAMF